MQLFLVLFGLGVLISMVLYLKKQQTNTVSIKPVTTKELETQITDAVTSVAPEVVIDVTPEVVTAEVVDAPKKRGRKPKITASAKKPVKGKKQVAPKTTRGRKKKS